MTKSLRFGDVCEEYALSKIFIEDLDASIHHSMCKYCGKREKQTYMTLHSTPHLLYATGTGRNVQGDELICSQAADQLRKTVDLPQIGRQCRTEWFHIYSLSSYEKSLGYAGNGAG